MAVLNFMERPGIHGMFSGFGSLKHFRHVTHSDKMTLHFYFSKMPISVTCVLIYKKKLYHLNSQDSGVYPWIKMLWLCHLLKIS